MSEGPKEMVLDEPVNTFRLLGSDTHADVIVIRWGREERCVTVRWDDEEGSVNDGGGRLASHIPFFFLLSTHPHGYCHAPW